MCCDGLSDWTEPNLIFDTIIQIGPESAINQMFLHAKDISLKTNGMFDDITAIALLWK